MGLSVSVYRSGSDCSNNGLSKFYDNFVVSNVEGPFVVTPERPELILVLGPFDTPRLVSPANVGKSPMFGGNYAGTSDSRFNRAVEKMTGTKFLDIVKIFDRIE